MFDGALYFSADGGDGKGEELWRFDGTAGSLPTRVTDINPGTAPSAPRDLTVLKGTMFFSADLSAGTQPIGRELWQFVPQRVKGAATIFVVAGQAKTGMDFGNVKPAKQVAARVQGTSPVAAQDFYPPTVERVDLVSDPTGRFINSVVLLFSEPLNGAAAEHLANYQVFSSPGHDRLWNNRADNTPVRITRARHVPGSDGSTVILDLETGRRGVRLNTLFQIIVSPTAGLSDRAGNLLDGNQDGVAGDEYATVIGMGTRLTYVEPDKDKVTLSVKHGGAMLLTLQPVAAGLVGQDLQLIDTVPTTALVGGVTKSRSGDGQATLRSVSPAQAGRHLRAPSIRVTDDGGIDAQVVDALLANGEVLEELPLWRLS